MKNARAGGAGAGACLEELSDSLSLGLCAGCLGAGRLSARRGFLDRRGLADAVAVPGDLDPARLPLLGLRDANVEHALMERRLDRVRIDALGQGQRAAELAERALESEEALLLALVLSLALAADRQRAVVELDRDVLLLHA